MIKKIPKKIAVLVIVVVSLIVIIAATTSLGTSKPVIEYSLSGYAYRPHMFSFNPYVPFYTSAMPDTYTVVNSNTPLMIALHWENKASIDASLQLTLTVQNANITWFSNYSTLEATDSGFSTPATGQQYNGTAITFSSETKSNSTLQNKYLNVFPIGNPHNFTIAYTIAESSNAFSLNPVGETKATYELTSENVYSLLK